MAKKPTLEHVEASLARWRSRLKRALTAIEKLEQQRKRLIRRSGWEPAKPVPVEPIAVQVMREKSADPIDTAIPEFLRRGKAAQAAVDQIVAAEIVAEQADVKKRKAAVRIQKMKAKQRGDHKKMPLSGKDALRAIYGD
jgi:hypothetical protein